MKNHKRIIAAMLAGVLGLMFIISGCGPTTFTKTRFEFRPYNDTESKQSREGVTIEWERPETPPAEFFADVQKCDPKSGKLYVDGEGNPVRARTIPPGGMWFTGREREPFPEHGSSQFTSCRLKRMLLERSSKPSISTSEPWSSSMSTPMNKQPRLPNR